MKIRTLLLSVFCLNGLLFAQNVSLNGKIFDSASKLPVQGAVVYLSNNIFAYSNNDGYYSIKNLPDGVYHIKISRIGYKPFNDSVFVNSANLSKDYYLENSPVELDEVIVITDRAGKYLRNSPYSELLLSKEKIQNQPFQSLSDVLKDEPGITLLRDGIWGTEISIRGLNRDNVVTLIDGSRIVTSTDIAARLSMININDIDRIEVIKGASSSIYGSGATGGIVNIITRSPGLYESFNINGNLTIGYNSVNNLSSFTGMVLSGSSFWSSKVSASYRKAGNVQTPVGELKNSQFKDYSLSGALNLFPFDNHLIKIDYQLFKAEDVGIPGASVFPDNADVRYPYEKREMISAMYEIQNISKALYKLSANYSYQVIERNVENIPHTVQVVPASGSTPGRRVSVLKITPAANHTNNNLLLHANFLLSENIILSTGIDYWDRVYNGHREKYQKIEVLNSQGSTVNTINKVIGEKPLPDSKYKSFGLFAQNDADIINDKLSLSIGARYDWINIAGSKTFNPVYDITNGVTNYSPAGQQVIWNKTETNDASYSGNLGIKYSLTSNIDFTLSLGLSFRSPSLEERFQYIDQGSFVRVGDPELKPERGRSADFGIRYYSNKVRAVSSFFFNHFHDLVTEIPGLFEGRNAFIKTNIGKAKLYGFDLRADYNFYNDHLVYLTCSYVKGDDITSGGNLPEIPPLNGTIGLKYSFTKTIYGMISSAFFMNQDEVALSEKPAPGYAILNFSLNAGNFELSAIKFSINTGIENVLNKEYRNHLSTTRGLIIVEPGRNFYVKLISNF